MKLLERTLLALALVLAIVLIQAPNGNETKSIKKVVKEMKKLKKYAYLLAANKKKLYAIPFPMPLPIFVKRQHIYTQVPIIPRYVQHPQQYGSPTVSSDTSYSYEMMASSYAPEVRIPSTYTTKPQSSGSSYGSRKKAVSTSSAGPSSSGSTAADIASQYLGNSGKYLSQIASLLGQASPMVGGAQRDILSKLISGQARVLPPTALLSAIKSSSLPASMQKPQGSEQQDKQNQHQDQDSQDQETKPHSQSNSGSSSSNSVAYDDSMSGSTTTTKPESTAENKPSASEQYRSAMLVNRPLRSMYNPFMNPYQFSAMMTPMMSPMAALASAGRMHTMPSRLPMIRSPIVNDMMVDPYDSLSQFESPNEVQDMAASSPQEHETSVAREISSPAYRALLKQRQLQQQQQQLELQSQPSEALLVAMQKAQRQQLLSRQQDAIKLALLREQEVAARLAESKQILVRAHQLGLPIVPAQSNALKYYSQQQQQQ